MNTKAKEKLVKVLGQVTAEELEAMDANALGAVIVQASDAIRTSKEELESNPKYQALKDALKDITAAKRELDARQKAKIAYSLELLEQKGQA
jgi:hypothetical protein